MRADKGLERLGKRIVYENRESDYCRTCQTGGELLADRARSRVLKDDCPTTMEEMEELRKRQGRK